MKSQDVKSKEEKREELYFSKLLDEFDEKFNTRISDSFKNMPLLTKIFHEFITEIYKTNELEALAERDKIKVKDELYKSLSKEQIELVEEIEFYNQGLKDLMCEKAFMYGFATSYDLKDEASKYKKGGWEKENEKYLSYGNHII